jgi:hypothetical protein
MINRLKALFTNKNAELRMLAALGLHSSAIIAFQLVLMQLISMMQWYHFAYMIISIAMLGFGAAGIVLALFRHQLLLRASWLIPSLMGLSGVFMILSFQIACLPVFQFDIYLLFVERSQFLILALNYLIFSLPFFLGALAIGIIFIGDPQKIGKFYFANLLGSGLGGIIMVVLLSLAFADTSLPFAAALSLLGALLSLHPVKKLIFQVLPLGAGLIMIVFSLFSKGEIPISQYKGLARTMLLPEAQIVNSKPDVYGRIDVVSSPALRYAPALSLAYSGEVPVKKNIYANGDFYGVVPLFDSTRSNIHDFTTEALPYVMSTREKVLVMDARAGAAISHALANGVDSVWALVEVKSVKDLMKNELSGMSSFLFHDPRVKSYYHTSRQFLFTNYVHNLDAVILPRMESFGGSAGLNALTENYALTIEAFGQMWDKLSDNGVIVVTSWLDFPPRTTLKIISTLMETLMRKGVESPTDHFAAIRSWGTITFLIKKEPIDSFELQNIRDFCEQMLFDPLILPDITVEERSRFNHIGDDSFFTLVDQILLRSRDSVYAKYEYFVAPATDDRPYFSRFIKAGGLPGMLSQPGSDESFFMELGYLIVWITFIQGLLLSVILIVLPLLRLKVAGGGKRFTVFYFAALGLGYMFVEIILIQRFVLYFGHPLFAVSAVISTMLIASGVGSYFSGKFVRTAKISILSTFVIFILVLIYAFSLTGLLMNTMHWAIGFRILFAVMLISVPSFIMGIPFPAGIRLLAGSFPDQIPWAWGINGSLSVIATALAILLAVEVGFRWVMLMAAFLYLMAFAIAFTTFATKRK